MIVTTQWKIYLQGTIGTHRADYTDCFHLAEHAGTDICIVTGENGYHGGGLNGRPFYLPPILVDYLFFSVTRTAGTDVIAANLEFELLK